MSRVLELICEFQNTIDHAPVASEQLYGQACANDGVTINSWRDTWLKNITDNKKKFGNFKDKSIGVFHKAFYGKSAIVAGSGPSLKLNVEHLKNRGDAIGLVSCLHNFHFMEDNGANVDFYVTLDAGEVTIEEVYEGGTKTPDEYWAITKDRTLLAYIGTSPRLLEKWQGPIYFFNCPVPDDLFMKKLEEIEKFNLFIGTGGNVLGASLYITKCILGASVTAFVGADFSFSNNLKFHAWNSKYDARLGHTVYAFNVYGQKVRTWQSYANFAAWFNWVAQSVPGIYINCTEGGIFGSYAEGNIQAVRQMELHKFIEMIKIPEVLTEHCLNPEIDEKRLIF